MSTPNITGYPVYLTKCIYCMKYLSPEFLPEVTPHIYKAQGTQGLLGLPPFRGVNMLTPS